MKGVMFVEKGRAEIIHEPMPTCADDTMLLKAIQWVPGAGRERLDQWHDVIRRILDAGKSVQLYGMTDKIDDLVECVGSRGLLVTVSASRAEAERLIARYGS